MRNDRERLLSHGISTHISKFNGAKNINTLSQRDYLHKTLNNLLTNHERMKPLRFQSDLNETVNGLCHFSSQYLVRIQ